jgi:heat shock protein HtpX
LENLCISRGITMPKLKIIETPALNAFASGMNEKQYSVTVTSGLVEALDDAELEAVLGHELTHIRNGDVRMLVIAVIIAGVISFFAEMFFRMFFYARWSGGRSDDSDRGKGGGGIAIVIAIALIALAWFLSVVIRFALSRRREYLADAGSVELTKNPDAMISALRKIENRGDLEGATSGVMEMCIDNPRSGFENLFDTHPAVDARVDALVRYAGGHDPGPLAVPQYDEAPALADQSEDAGPEAQTATPDGPFGPSNAGGKPFLPPRPPIQLGTPSPTSPASGSGDPGPWGPHGGSTR